MKFHILGSCSGTEPMPERHQTSIWLETDDRSYLFDAGENCAYTACMMGLDPLKIHGIFISHPHMDHVGGLPHFLWTIRKLTLMRNRPLEAGVLPVHTPDLSQFEAILRMLGSTEGHFGGVEVQSCPVRDGEIFQDGTIRVEAIHNLHLGVPEDGCWKSYSFRITCGGKKIVYSGDIKSLSDISGWLAEGCSLLMTETGHHHPWEVAAELRQRNFRPERLVFVHHGRDFLNHFDESLQKTEAAWGGKVTAASDRMTIEL